ncbi:MAG: M24 family metallopeptidase, partial [Halocynthiibacter sp.]
MTKAAERLKLLRNRMEAEQVDLVALGPGPHMQWLLGFHPHADERPCLLCVSQSGAAFLMPVLNAEGSRVHTELVFHEWSDADGPEAAFARLLDDLGARDADRIVLDETMRADFAALVQDTLPGATRQFTGATIGLLRMRKDGDEYAALKANARIADAAMQAGWAAMGAGMTELQVAGVIRDEFSELGAKPLFSIVGAGGNGAFPHHQTGDTVLNS